MTSNAEKALMWWRGNGYKQSGGILLPNTIIHNAVYQHPFMNWRETHLYNVHVRLKY